MRGVVGELAPQVAAVFRRRDQGPQYNVAGGEVAWQGQVQI